MSLEVLDYIVHLMIDHKRCPPQKFKLKRLYARSAPCIICLNATFDLLTWIVTKAIDWELYLGLSARNIFNCTNFVLYWERLRNSFNFLPENLCFLPKSQPVELCRKQVLNFAFKRFNMLACEKCARWWILWKNERERIWGAASLYYHLKIMSRL
jgi:hypothetical protein